ncbi:MAG TPA: NADP-dependent malic enzyme [Flavobacteriales bacterium]|nr:NADP-dependent malic enzyme [Flavobacteriales bacterium]
MKISRLKREALEYHENGRPGKIEVIPTKPYSSQRDLSLAYSPGVAEPCLEIQKKPTDAYRYTAKGNLVAVISNGTAVLGLGDIGALASKPVMEGKALLFKIFADIDGFDIEVNAKSIDEFVNTVKAIAPTFGGINLEDIKAPESFEIERRLIEELDIPIMHDDQHGTAIIASAALINALELVKKKLNKIKIVVNGAGASALACSRLFVSLGANKKNIHMFDSKGMIVKSRTDLSEDKAEFALDTKSISLADCMKGADFFIGLSRGNIVSKKMVKDMADHPIVFALANPDPEITYHDAKTAKHGVIMATGRSDNPNQVNNVLGFPYIFRGALDVRATGINEAMKLAAVKAIASIAKEPVPEIVNAAYKSKNLVYGPDFIIPKPLDPRLITKIAPAVARAAMESGIAQKPITDWEAYERELSDRLGLDNKFVRNLTLRAKSDPKRVVFAEADTYKILKAAQIVRDEGIAIPILLGNVKTIHRLVKENHLDLDTVQIIDPKQDDQEETRRRYGKVLFEKRKRKGYTLYEASEVMRGRSYYGNMMVELGEADAFISGLTRNYPTAIRPALEIIGKEEGTGRIAGMHIIWTKKSGPYFFADTTVNIEPSSNDLVDISLLVAKSVRSFNLEPKLALLSYSNFGSVFSDESKKIGKAIEILHRDHKDIVVDGEIQANFALDKDLRNDVFPFNELAEHKTNTLIFPNLASGNIAYKLIGQLGEAEMIGPVVLGLNKSVHILQMGSTVREIVNMVTIAVADAQTREA